MGRPEIGMLELLELEANGSSFLTMTALQRESSLNLIQMRLLHILMSMFLKVEFSQIAPGKHGQKAALQMNTEGSFGLVTSVCEELFFLELGGLDERFEVAYEDVDFAYRAKLAGTKFLFVREAQACHPWRSVRQGGKNWKTKNYESADFVRFLKKHNPSEAEFSFFRYLRNLFRMATSDFLTCVLVYRMRGLDILFFSNARYCQKHVRHLNSQ